MPFPDDKTVRSPFVSMAADSATAAQNILMVGMGLIMMRFPWLCASETTRRTVEFPAW
jgi:hypothetical protein